MVKGVIFALAFSMLVASPTFAASFVSYDTSATSVSAVVQFTPSEMQRTDRYCFYVGASGLPLGPLLLRAG